MIAHLEEQSARCKAVILNTFERLPPDEVAMLDGVDAAESRRLVHSGSSRVKATLPVIRLQGPLTFAATAAGISHVSGPRGRKPVS